MSNIAKVLKAGISRVSRKEAKIAIGGIGKSHAGLKKIVADLKKRVVLLEKENKRLAVAIKKGQAGQSEKVEQDEGRKARFTSRGIQSLRKKLRLSQGDFGKLVGATAHSVYLWEKKKGALKLRDKTKAAILSIRGLSAGEARTKLDQAGTKRRRSRKAAA